MQEKPESGRYRQAIDSGKTHDKVKGEDPAAAPLHTDSEAAGRPVPRESAAATARTQQAQHASDVPAATHQVPGRGQQQIPDPLNAWLLGGTFVAAAALGAAVAYLLLP